jgi:hypothetical protein
MSTPSNPPKRFPRIHPGDTSAALALLLRSEPVFRIKFPKDRMSVVFSYEYSIPDQLPPELLELYVPSFTGGLQYWKNSLAVAKKKAEEEEKRAFGRVHNFHQGILTDGFEINLLDSWAFGEGNLAHREEELARFQKDSALASGRKPNAWTACQAAMRFRQLDEILKDMLHRLKAKPSQAINQEARIKKAIERTKLSQKLIRRGLVDSYGEGTDIALLLERRVHHKTIARGIVRCELKDRGCDLSLISGSTYIAHGIRILDALNAFTKRQKSDRVGTNPPLL